MLTSLQSSWEFQKPIYICSIDLEKPFNRVQSDNLYKYLEMIGINRRYLRHWHNLYGKPEAAILIDNNETDKISKFLVKLTNKYEVPKMVSRFCFSQRMWNLDYFTKKINMINKLEAFEIGNYHRSYQQPTLGTILKEERRICY